MFDLFLRFGLLLVVTVYVKLSMYMRMLRCMLDIAKLKREHFFSPRAEVGSGNTGLSEGVESGHMTASASGHCVLRQLLWCDHEHKNR